MDSKLVIVESPAKARTIGRILGKDYIIKASMGHVRDLPEKTFGVDIEHDFAPQYEETGTRSKNLNDLKSAAKKVGDIYLASDPDREGEAIAWHLKEVLRRANKNASFHRVSFHEITESAISRAFRDPGQINMDLVDSQQARRVLDRIVGYLVSPLLWSRIKRGVSAGRVQSVALRLVCEREREISAFVPREYWNFRAQFEAEKDAGRERRFTAKLVRVDSRNVDISNEADAGALLNSIRSASDWKVTSIETVPRRKNPPPPFITSTLQQAASSSLGFSASQTMRIAQQLYEGVEVNGASLGLITYMRTDSVAVAAEAAGAARSFIAREYGQDYMPEKPNVYRSKANAQGAHEAIRPTDVSLTPEKLSSALDPQQKKLYTLIWKRFLASQMTPVRQSRTTVDVEASSSSSSESPHVYTFRSTATVTVFPGFLRAYNLLEEGAPQEDEDDTPDAGILAGLTLQERCLLVQSDSEQKFTEPPPRFSEATLIKELESNGIGRPSTYAAIVNTIQTRKYVSREKGKLIPTDLGFQINDYLVATLPALFQVGFTASMEEQLDSVEEGKVVWTDMMRDFYGKFSRWLNDAKNAGAPEKGKASALIHLMREIVSWEKPEKIPGKRLFNEKKFFDSVCSKYDKDGTLSEKQWNTLLSLALKYRSQLSSSLEETAEANGFSDDLHRAEELRAGRENAREERLERLAAAQASAPPQEDIASVLSALEGVVWDPPEKRRGRVYDDGKFFESLKKQSASGKLLSEKQLGALGKLLLKYRSAIPSCDEFLKKLGKTAPSSSVPADSVSSAVPGESSASFPDSASSASSSASVSAASAEGDAAGKEEGRGDEDAVRQETALLFRKMEHVRWEEPEMRRGRVYDDKKFFESLKKQFDRSGTLTGKQTAALLKIAGKYFPDENGRQTNASEKDSSVMSAVSGGGPGGTGDRLRKAETLPASGADLPADKAKSLLASFEKITQWAEPVKRGARTYDDRAFVSSIREQFEKGKILSPKQLAALEKLAAKYSL